MSSGNSHCSVVGMLGMLIQIILGVLSFSVLILKRHFQSPKRPWRIWRYDTFKQAFSQLLAHFINLTISMALTSESPDSDTCLWYFTTNVFDNTMGVFLCVLILRKIQKQLIIKKKFQLISGNYYQIKTNSRDLDGQKENEEQIELSAQTIEINYHAWLLQLVIWNMIVIFSKILLFIMEFFLRAILNKISQVLLGWIEKYPTLQLIFVIVVVPVIMNGFAFWVQDNFLKKRDITNQVQEIEAEIQMKKATEKQATNEEMRENKKQQENYSPSK